MSVFLACIFAVFMIILLSISHACWSGTEDMYSGTLSGSEEWQISLCEE